MPAKNTEKKIKFSAFGTSIAIHIIALLVLAGVQFSKGQAEGNHNPTPKASVSEIQKYVNNSPVMPKPKVKERFKDFRNRKKKIYKLEREEKAVLANNADVKPEEFDVDNILADQFDDVGAVEFFGNKTSGRKICYVVDCSGSMLGLFRNVRNQLTESIQKLNPDNYFYIILFRGTGLVESGCGQLTRATPAMIEEAIEEVAKSPRPYGQGDAITALRKAFAVKDTDGNNADVIYFLTDGFDFSSEENLNFAQKVEQMRKHLAPKTKIHTIGFWASSKDREMLDKIAASSGGRYVYYSK